MNGVVRFQQLSTSFEKITGYPPKVFLDNEKEWLSIVHQEDHDSVQDAMTRRVVDGNIDQIEYRIIHLMVKCAGFKTSCVPGASLRTAFG
jgi:PAS domain-containing protein